MMYNLAMTMRHQIVKESMMRKTLIRTKKMMMIRRGKIPKEKITTKTTMDQ